MSKRTQAGTNVVRHEQPGDAAVIRTVVEGAFSQAVEADLVDRLRQTCEERLSLVALSDDRIVGHILFTPVIIETDEGPFVGAGLAPMAVLPDFQRTGIGSALVRAGTEHLRQSGCPFVLVVGHPAYYPRFGFVPACQYGIRCQWSGVPDEAFMVHVLQPSTAAGLAGLAKYRAEFDEAL